ncbi:hypothetical protein I7I48_07429 [Histoplasma ohiense]|nr:hypothetical protein I7I48_07429 [Histoplasma ohiense (nom. inval.)]
MQSRGSSLSRIVNKSSGHSSSELKSNTTCKVITAYISWKQITNHHRKFHVAQMTGLVSQTLASQQR